jgi:tetratricopeptide (TPR) repeat protein
MRVSECRDQPDTLNQQHGPTMRALSLAVVLISAVFGAANAQTHDQQWTWCEDQNPDVSIRGCTAIIQSGQGTPESRASAFTNRGRAYAYKAQPDRVIQDYDQAIQLNPNDLYAFTNRGIAYAGVARQSR